MFRLNRKFEGFHARSVYCIAPPRSNLDAVIERNPIIWLRPTRQVLRNQNIQSGRGTLKFGVRMAYSQQS